MLVSSFMRKITCQTGCKMARIFAISDIHVDHFVNKEWIQGLDHEKYTNDVLLLAGDVTDSLTLLKSTLESLKTKFKEVFYVPGNHELWIRDKSSSETSVGKFNSIIKMCKTLSVHTEPRQVETSDGECVWIVPLFSWYATPEEDRQDSLYVSGPSEDPSTLTLWMDNHMCKWPDSIGSRSKFFGKLNEDRVCAYDAPVISFSHFLPRMELIQAEAEDEHCVGEERRMLGLQPEMPKRQGAMAGFNFTRYAGCKTLERQIRIIGSQVHVYGHQHRNRDRLIDGVRYVSHCLGYKKERDEGLTYGITHWKGPKQVWPKAD
ncbi:uncharacterized protein LOC110973829 [Acanthaster planci]|uniref:Uncharacterized protein LOC110973829 n=1 Tax=Acanthaster planci TaxID=133434 RepID=A0A8B7XIM9_ACAPL|nr:uncharacterized protein LOC110973829 [Acanthaster planci]